jgi:hypothetical protein
MTIEIQKPEPEALIIERMKLGAFPTAEDFLIEALNSSRPPSERGGAVSNGVPGPTGADLVAARQSSPCREIALESARGWLWR